MMARLLLNKFQITALGTSCVISRNISTDAVFIMAGVVIGGAGVLIPGLVKLRRLEISHLEARAELQQAQTYVKIEKARYEETLALLNNSRIELKVRRKPNPRV